MCSYLILHVVMVQNIYYSIYILISAVIYVCTIAVLFFFPTLTEINKWILFFVFFAFSSHLYQQKMIINMINITQKTFNVALNVPIIEFS